MSNIHKIDVERRNDEGKGASRRLRRTGKVPAIVYGGSLPPTSIQMDHEKIWLASQHDWFYSSILELSVEGKSYRVLLRDLQRHPYKQLILHLDFQRVNENESLRASVPLHFVNAEISPAGKTGGVLIMHELNEVEVQCLPKDLPEYIEVDLSDLKLGDSIHMSELALPAGVEIPELKLGKEYDQAVVIARHARVEASEEAAGGDEAAEGESK